MSVFNRFDFLEIILVTIQYMYLKKIPLLYSDNQKTVE